MGVDVPWYYMTQGQYDQMILWVLRDYVGYGIIYVLLGVAVYATVQEKSRSAAISGFVFALFLGIFNYFLPVEIQMWFTIIIALMLFTILYRVLR